MKSWKQREMLFGGAILTFIVPLKSDLILWTLHICLQFDINEIIFVITFTVALEMLSDGSYTLEMLSDGSYNICKLCTYH